VKFAKSSSSLATISFSKALLISIESFGQKRKMFSKIQNLSLGETLLGE
jgi:hypothetical protein